MTTIAMTIAGSDPSGGAGLQADLKTFHQHRVYGTAVVTLLTVQNTKSVSRVETMPPDLVREQIVALLDDVPPSAAKTGALGTAAIVDAIAELATRFTFPLVVDPVMISKHGAPLVDADATRAFRERLLPHAHLVTPNAPEATVLCGIDVRDRRSAIDAARAIADLGPHAVLIKGGHLTETDAVDVLYVDGHVHELSAPRLSSAHTHGTGCTYSAAITARLAIGERLLEAVSEAKGWLTDAIKSAPQIGHGVGPVNHHAPIGRWSVPPPEPGG